MIYKVPRKPIDQNHIKESVKEHYDTFDYSGVIVKKPWGYEYLVFENDFVAIWMLQIIRKRRTSSHCHHRKKTGLILLSSHATFHHLESSIAIDPLDAINIEAGDSNDCLLCKHKMGVNYNFQGLSLVLN